MRRTLIYLHLCAGLVLYSPIEAAADEPGLADRYVHLQVSDVQLNEDTIDKILQKLTKILRREQPGAISIVLVTPSDQLLEKHVTKRFHNLTLKQIIDELCVTFGLHYSLDYHTIIVGAKEVDLSKNGLRKEPSRENETLETGMRIVIPKMEFSGVEVTTAVNTIREQSERYNATEKPFILQSKLKLAKPEPKVYAWFPLCVSAEAIEYICMSAGVHFSSPSEGVYVLLGEL